MTACTLGSRLRPQPLQLCKSFTLGCFILRLRERVSCFIRKSALLPLSCSTFPVAGDLHCKRRCNPVRHVNLPTCEREPEQKLAGKPWMSRWQHELES